MVEKKIPKQRVDNGVAFKVAGTISYEQKEKKAKPAEKSGKNRTT